MGLEYLVKAGYYPRAIIDFLKIMKQNEFISKTMPSYLLTHPGTDDRMIYMDSLIMTRYPQKGVKNIIGNLSRMQTLIPLEPSDLNRKLFQLELFLKNDPDNVDLIYGLAAVEDQLEKTDSSLKHYQKALSLSPGDDDILKKIGLIYLKLGKSDLAQEYLLKAISLSPNDEAYLALGKAYFASGKYQKALDHYLKIEGKELDDANIDYLVAMTYGKLDRRGESHYYFGLYFKKMNKKESALFHFRQALNYFPQDSERNNVIQQEINSLNNSEKQRSVKQKTKH